MWVSKSLTNSFRSIGGRLRASPARVEITAALALTGSRPVTGGVAPTDDILPFIPATIVCIFDGRAVVGVSVSVNGGSARPGGRCGDCPGDGLAEADLEDEGDAKPKRSRELEGSIIWNNLAASRER
jgi:hypothetical protein